MKQPDIFGPEDAGVVPAAEADLSIRITQFLNRWTWRQDTATVRTELEALIAEARKS